MIVSAIGHCLPGAKFHDSEFAVDEYLLRLVEDAVLRDDDVNSAMNQTDNDGIGEVYLPIEEFHLAELPPPGEELDLSFGGHVSMDIDTERPYSGHRIPVQVALWLEAKGRVCFAAPRFEVLEAGLDYGWGDDEVPQQPPRTLAEALADALGLEVAEAEELVDIEPIVNESDDGLVYSYLFDFSEEVSPELAQKILANHGELRLEVSPAFFDGVRRADD